MWVCFLGGGDEKNVERKLSLSLSVCVYVFGGWVEGGDGLVIRKDTTDSRVM